MPGFRTISVQGQSSIVADASPDTLNIIGSSGIAMTSNPTNDTITFTPTFGSTAGTICQGNDSRIGAGGTPTTHASTHAAGGTDPIKLDALAAPDDGTTLNATTGAHGLLRKLSNNASQYMDGTGNWSTPGLIGVRVTDPPFNAVGDGSTNDTAAFIDALAAANTVFVPYKAAGYNLNTGNITIASGKRLIGERQVKLFSSATSLFNVTAYGEYCGIENFTIDMAGASAGAVAIKLKTGSAVIFRVKISHILFTSCFIAIQDEGVNYVVEMDVTYCRCVLTRGRQVYISRSRGFITFSNFAVDHTYNTGQVTWEGMRFEDLIGVELYNVDVVGPIIPTATYQSAAIGIVLDGIGTSQGSVWLRRVLVDNARGPGIYIRNLFNVYGLDISVYQTLGTNIIMTNVIDSHFANTISVGAIGVTGAAAGATGLILTTCNNVSFTNYRGSWNTGHGLVVDGSTDCRFTNVHCNNNTGWGIIHLSPGNRNITVNARMHDNGSGDLSQLGAASATVGWIANAGTYRASDVGAVNV